MDKITLYSPLFWKSFSYLGTFLGLWWSGFLVADYIKNPIMAKIAGFIWLLTVVVILIIIGVGLNTIWQKVG